MEPYNDIRNFNFTDIRIDGPLEAILPMGKRLTELMLRSRSTYLHTDFIQISGAVSMVEGIEYHFARFLESIPSVREKSLPAPDLKPARHEAVAWLNRVGQFHSFMTSKFVRDQLGVVDLPAIEETLLFRNKHAAHRSIDKPRDEDLTDRLSQAISMSELGGSIWALRPGCEGADVWLPIRATHYLCFQMRNDEVHHNLVIEKLQPIVLEECYSLFKALLT